MNSYSRLRARPVMILRGKELLKVYMAKHLVGREEFFNSKFPEHVEKRKDLIRILLGAGLYQIEIARVIERAPNTIKYWINPEYRDRRLTVARERLRRIAQEARA
jgi:hypothetical protein